VATGASVLDVARSLGVDLDSVCGGRGLCGRCQVQPVEGEFPKFGLVSSPISLSGRAEVENRYDARKGLAADRRLGCQARIAGDVVIDVPPESQLHKQVVRKRVEVSDVEIDPVIRLYYIEPATARLEQPGGDVERVRSALADQWGLRGLSVGHVGVGQIREACSSHDGLTVAVRDGGRIVAAWPGLHEGAYGVAFDVGSTTVAGQLCHLFTGQTLASAGRMNPQIRYGEDLMSRVSYVVLNPDGAHDLTTAIREALAGLLGELAGQAGVAAEEVLEVTLVANPIMHHLVFGFDVRPLGETPFRLATSEALEVGASDLGLGAHPAARVYALPAIAGHVGADTAGAILSESPHLADDLQLLVDVGTNAEIVLGNRHRILAASSPTGPAFEGAQISSGVRATRGAIERVRVDAETLESRFRVIGCDLWSDEDGFDAAVSITGVTGICGSGIIEAVAELYLAGVVAPDGLFDPAAASRSPRVVPHGRTHSYRLTDTISVSQNDVRAIQLAKAALAAGIRLLMDRMGADAVDQIRLAGAFGSHIDVFHAMVLGLIPDCPLDRVSAAGNAAGAGAVIALLNRAARSEIEDVVRKIDKVETAVEPAFQQHFVDAMAFPHGTDPYPSLSARVTLPRSATAAPRRRRRRLKDSA
jgi:uncharacterized 2Fe-2S/4Fe-4S cluster protein (DUF4445 family)